MEELKNLLTIQESDLEIGDWLGGGSTAAVFKGVWHHDGEAQVVTIKKMTICAEDAADICRELNTMLNHAFENVCKLYGGCVIGDRQVWLVMEYANGGDLHYYLRRCESPLSQDIQLSLFIQATKALAAMHNAPSPIIHRDIKSHNFLVQNNSELLLDFGISKARSTNAGNNVAKIRWLAPEVISTNNGHSDRSDIFSLGMVFYEIINRELPYQDSNLTQILDKIKRGVRPKLADCPKEWRKIIHRCWSYKPEKRPNINELLAMWTTIETNNQNEDTKKFAKDKSPANSPKFLKKHQTLATSCEVTIVPDNLVGLSDSNAIPRISKSAHWKANTNSELIVTSISIENCSTLESPVRPRSLSMNDADGGRKARSRGIRNFFSGLRKVSGKVFGRKKDKQRETDVKSEVLAMNAIS